MAWGTFKDLVEAREYTFAICDTCGAAIIFSPHIQSTAGETPQDVHDDWHNRNPEPHSDEQ